MAIRVTQNTMYNKMVGHMQSNLAGYMESVEQGSSQKKINRPSDDPAGTYRVLTTRVDMNQTKQLQENVDTAKGWLKLADDVLSKQVTTAISGLKALAEQAATGTYNADQRRIMADQARQYFGQLLNLSNTEFEGKSIFAGHKYDQNAFEQGLALDAWDDEDWDSLIKDKAIEIKGSSNSTILIDFPGANGPLAEGMSYHWSNDGGQTWNKEDAVIKEGDKLVLQPTGAGVTIEIDADKANDLNITGADVEDKDKGPKNGTFLYVRPTAIYQGDDQDPPVSTSLMGPGGIDNIKATGSFGGNVYVRMDENVDLTTPGKPFNWSYSTDGGETWVPCKGTTTDTGDYRLPIPGGYVEFEAKGDEIKAGNQIIVHPSRADLSYEIMNGTYLNVNSVGKDVFGGYYNGAPALNGDDNLFEVVGSFIGYLEGNNQEGCQRTLVALTTAEKKVLAEATRIGGMENRLEMAADVLSFQKIDQQERLSYVEDIDLTDLLTKMTRQQLAYQTVLQSSSMIMQMSLAKYV